MSFAASRVVPRTGRSDTLTTFNRQVIVQYGINSGLGCKRSPWRYALFQGILHDSPCRDAAMWVTHEPQSSLNGFCSSHTIVVGDLACACAILATSDTTLPGASHRFGRHGEAPSKLRSHSTVAQTGKHSHTGIQLCKQRDGGTKQLLDGGALGGRVGVLDEITVSFLLHLLQHNDLGQSGITIVTCEEADSPGGRWLNSV
jgi:hypothetical protein